MARKWSNLNLPGALHFVTGNCIKRLPVFTEPECCEAFLSQLQRLSKEWPAKLIAYVVCLIISTSSPIREMVASSNSVAI